VLAEQYADARVDPDADHTPEVQTHQPPVFGRTRSIFVVDRSRAQLRAARNKASLTVMAAKTRCAYFLLAKRLSAHS
jgi:hypothetical protein